VKYQVGNSILETQLSETISDLFIRTRAARSASIGSLGSSVSLSNLVFVSDGTTDNLGNVGTEISIADPGSSNSAIAYFQVTDFSQPFHLSGDILFSWQGTRPKNSELAFQIKATTSNQSEVPEPGFLAGLLTLLASSAVFKRRSAAL